MCFFFFFKCGRQRCGDDATMADSTGQSIQFEEQKSDFGQGVQRRSDRILYLNWRLGGFFYCILMYGILCKIVYYFESVSGRNCTRMYLIDRQTYKSTLESIVQFWDICFRRRSTRVSRNVFSTIFSWHNMNPNVAPPGLAADNEWYKQQREPWRYRAAKSAAGNRGQKSTPIVPLSRRWACSQQRDLSHTIIHVSQQTRI